MPLIGGKRDHLLPLRDRHDHLVGDTIGAALDQRAVLLGALIARDVEQVCDRHGRTVDSLTVGERNLLETEARVAWARKAAGIGDQDAYHRLRDLGKGTT